MMLLAESVRAVPKYQSNKTPLQRAVQILKRHRDIMFAGDEDKPVSIIITTLAAKAYQEKVRLPKPCKRFLYIWISTYSMSLIHKAAKRSRKWKIP